MDHIQTTIDHLCNEKPIKAERAAVLVCPPLTKERFEKEKKEPHFIAKQFGRKREFIKRLNLSRWEIYERQIVLHAFKQLLEIENQYSAVVMPDLKFKHFKKVIRSQYFDVIFLVAHHIIHEDEIPGNNNGTILAGEIEFADGGVPLEKIHKFLSHLETGNRMSLTFIVCETNELQNVSYNLPAINSVAAAFWKMDFLDGIEFIKYWIRFLNGKNTLSQAYRLAVDALLKH